MDATGGSGSNSPVWPIVETPSSDDTADENITKLKAASKSKGSTSKPEKIFHVPKVRFPPLTDPRLESRISAMDNSLTIGSNEEADNVKILQSCNGLLLCSGLVSPTFDYLKTEDRQLTLYKFNIDNHNHPIITTIEIPNGLHQGRNFLHSFSGKEGSYDPMLEQIDLPGILQMQGRLFESRGCLLLVCRDYIGSREFTIYEMMKGCSIWTVRDDIGSTEFTIYEMMKGSSVGSVRSVFDSSIAWLLKEGKIQKDKKKPRGEKGKDKEKNKLAYAPKPKILPPPKRDNLAKDSVCHHYKEEVETMGNGMRAVVEAIRSFDLIIPSGLVIMLDNYHFSPSVTRGVVLISRLVNNGYIHTFMNYATKEPNMHLDSFYLWHCRLGYINKKRMDKLQRDEISQPTHDESLEKCKSCISGKMARKPFSHQEEKSKDLLGLIYTDVEMTPYEIWHNKAPKLSYLRGCKALVKRDAFDKLDPRSINCIFAGYPKETMGYYFYYPIENKIFVALNVEFFENSLIVQEASESHGLLESSESDGELELIQEEDTQPYENTSEIHNEVAPIEVEPQNVEVSIRRSAGIPQAPDRYGFYAMNTEMQSMKDNQVWVLVDLPPNGRTVGSKWLFKKRLTWMEIAVRILLAIAAFYDYEIWQIDVKLAFLNGHLSEDIYMVQPEGFLDLKHPNKVCKLQRSIYGLKQVSRSWNKRFDVEIKKISFTQNPDDPCVYLKASGSNVAFPILYVDDILLMGNNVTLLQEVKSYLCKCFSMKDLGEAAYILGIKIIRDRSKWLIALSQSAYLEKILKRCWMENSKKGYTLMIEKPDYRKSQGAKSKTPTEVQHMQKVPYASAIGSIMNTKDMVLVYEEKPEAELKVSCYANASFQTDKNETKSQMRYVFILNGGAVDWKSAKQSTTFMSSIDVEYIVAAKASMEAVWMSKYIDGLGGVVPSNKRPMQMLCDNEPAIAIANDPEFLKGARYFQRKNHYIREVIQEREIVLEKVHTYDNVVDPFTKPVSYDKNYEHAMTIGIVPA
uniref:Reverse transcriptase Ty1/copia-type domain-containing protein n=1 Tax=Tanacetum cinerariifolium TaxID=118510 RepID=A0A6L2MWS7_TANCI|nr:hypothetical protein [Tanacetum cinerariifolium]